MHVDSEISLYYIAIGAVKVYAVDKIFEFGDAGIPKGNNSGAS